MSKRKTDSGLQKNFALMTDFAGMVLATETRPPAAQISQSFTSGANAPVATLA